MYTDNFSSVNSETTSSIAPNQWRIQDFQTGDPKPIGVGTNLLFWQFLPKNSMKMKKNGTHGCSYPNNAPHYFFFEKIITNYYPQGLDLFWTPLANVVGDASSSVPNHSRMHATFDEFVPRRSGALSWRFLDPPSVSGGSKHGIG